jgi:2-oxo-3-hexenedioate decarboxylase
LKSQRRTVAARSARVELSRQLTLCGANERTTEKIGHAESASLETESSIAMNRADLVLEAFDSHRLIGLLSDSDPLLEEQDAYAIAREVHARRLARGERPVGRKIGFTNRTVWPHYGVWQPIWGYVYDSTTLRAGAGQARARIGHLIQPRIEPEIQLHFARTPPVTRDEEAILTCIDWIAQGFEIVQCPFPEWRFRAVDAIAAYAVHGALVVGRPVASPASRTASRSYAASRLRCREVASSKRPVRA